MAAPVVGLDGSQSIAQNALSARIALAAQRGQISSLDRVALGNALTAIKGDFVSSIADGESRLSPYEMKTRIESLIDAQIAGGTLSSTQAAQLRGFYSAASPPPEDNGSPAGDDLPPPPSNQAAEAQPRPKAADAGAPPPEPKAEPQTNGDAKDEFDAMVQFVNLLRETMNPARSGYSSAGSAFPVRRAPLVVDTLA